MSSVLAKCGGQHTGTLNSSLDGRLKLCTVLFEKQGMIREAKYFNLTGVCAHVSAVVIAQEGIMPGRASSSRLGSRAVPTNPNCGNIGLSVYPLKAQKAIASFCSESQRSMSFQRDIRHNLSCLVMVVVVKSRPTAKAKSPVHLLLEEFAGQINMFLFVSLLGENAHRSATIIHNCYTKFLICLQQRSIEMPSLRMAPRKSHQIQLF